MSNSSAVRPDNLPAINPVANYPLQGIIGKVINFQGASDQYLDPRGPIFVKNVRPLPNVPLDTSRYLAYQREFQQTQSNLDGSGYSRDLQSVNAEGFTTFAGPSLRMRATQKSFRQ